MLKLDDLIQVENARCLLYLNGFIAEHEHAKIKKRIDKYFAQFGPVHRVSFVQRAVKEDKE